MSEVSIFGGRGRPAPDESERRRREFVGYLASGDSFRVAASRARVSPARALDLLWDQRELCHLDEELSKAA